MGKAPLQIEGLRFGMIVAVQRIPIVRKGGRATWLFRCDCGNEFTRTAVDVTQTQAKGSLISCGCQKSRMMSENGKRRRTHGLTRTNKKLYDVWRQMIRRCNHPTCKDFPLYGGRGITVCAAWNDVVAFENWAKSSGYAEGLTIDRRDNDGPYSPENCEWVSNLINCNHTRKVRWVEAHGRRQSISDWVRETGIPYRKLLARLNLGWEPERALRA